MNNASPERRHDLDALRAVAMLLGIGLHGALSFSDVPWVVQDTRQNDAFGLFVAVVHGFRMPAFFVMSGFFTAMLWRRRGLPSLLRHRARRIFLPLLLGLFTVIPAVNWISAQAIESSVRRNVETAEPVAIDKSDLVEPFAAAQDAEFTAWDVLTMLPVFHHLWFLWFLCWLMPAFAVYAVAADRIGWAGPPSGPMLGAVRYLWLVPLTMGPQWFMAERGAIPEFGPDTSTALLPMPHLLAYYAVFFFFGALYHDCGDREGRVGRRWAVALPVALLIVFPVGLVLGLIPRTSVGHHLVSGFMQTLFAWMMVFALMGVFRRYASRASRAWRYVSDSSYWLYAAHLPLVIWAQMLVRPLEWPASAKFLAVTAGVTGVLLLSYRYLIRYTPVGALLNGPRQRAPSAT